MSAAHVLTPARSGVYRTPAHVDAVKQARDEDHLWIDVDLSHAGSKSELLDLLAREVGFPSTFGRNWDALADALQDLSWRPAKGYVMRLVHAARAGQALGADWATLIEVLRLTASYWKTRGVAFVAFVDDAAGLPLWI
jgi:RNAse (barnase) inhibitor barstar